MKSPCIKLCKIEDGKCLGCYRTLDQIKNWSNYTDRERDDIMDDIIQPNPHNSSIDTKHYMILRKTVYTVEFLGHSRTGIIDQTLDNSVTANALIDEKFDDIKEWRKYITSIKYLD